MSDLEQKSGSPCDQALDYLYEMLDGQHRARFLSHLGTCARCQAELASYGRVREVAQAVLPSVEPSERLTGALHAQLMHEAAQRKAGGKVLPFVRRLVRHPAYAAAAGLLLIGGAVGLSWSRGRLTMMPSEPTMSAPVAPAKPAAGPVIAATPVAEAPVAAPAENTARLEQPAVRMKEDRASGSLADPPQADKRTAEPMRSRKVLGGQRELDGLFGSNGDSALAEPSLGAKGGAAERGEGGGGSGRVGLAKDASSVGQGTIGHQAAGAPVTNGTSMAGLAPVVAEPATPVAKSAPASARPQKKEAPPAVASSEPVFDRKPAVSEAPARRSEPSVAERDRNAAPGRPSAGKALNSLDDLVVADSAPSAPAQRATPRGAVQNEDEEAAPRATSDALANRNGGDAVDAERQRAGKLAQAGRCEEAASLYGSLDRRQPERLNAQDRLTYVRCLRMLGRLDPAQSELDQLRANRQQTPLPAAVLNAEQKALDVDLKRRLANTPSSTGERRSVSKAKKAFRSADSYEAAPSSAPADASSNQKRLTY